MLQLNPVYLLWNRRKTLTGSPDPTHANGTNKPCMYSIQCIQCYVSQHLQHQTMCTDTHPLMYTQQIR